MNFESGEKVVCVDGNFPPEIGALYEQLPVEGRVYVVRDVRLGIAPDGKGAASVLLEGLSNPRANSRAALERGFSGERFRRSDK